MNYMNKNIYNYFLWKYNVSLFDKEIEEVIELMNKETDPNSCEKCKERRAVSKCPLEKEGNMCKVVRHNGRKEY